MRRPKTALSPKRIAFCLLRIKSYTPTSSFIRWEARMTRSTSDCSDSHFPTNKGPKYLQYSNSLNTFILCFFTAALGYVLNVLNSYSILYSSRTFLLVGLISGWFSYIIFPKLYQANYPRPFMGLSGALIPKNGKKQCVSEVDFNELKQQTCYWETLHWYYIGGVTLWELLHPVFRVWWMLILVIIKL